MTAPDTTTTGQTYDAAGRTLTTTDAAGRVAQQTYDAAGRLETVMVALNTPEQATTRYAYDLLGRQVAVTDARGATTRYAYDAAGRLETVTDPLNRTTRYGYDAAGQQTTVTDAGNRTTTTVYDALGRVQEVVYPDNARTRTEYDASGLPVRQTDALGRLTTMRYDAAGRLEAVSDPLGNTTRYAYDLVGNLVAQIDANEHTVGYTYDARNRPVEKVWPDNTRETMAYDPVGNLLAHTLADGNTNSFQYDAMNRRTVIDLFDTDETYAFTYTATGQRASATDARGTTTYGHDAQDRVTSIALPGGQSVGYSYDPVGNRTQLTSAAGVQGYSYDLAGQLETMTDPQGGLTRYQYNAVGQVARMGQPNGVYATYGYDARDRVTNIAYVNPNTGLNLAAFDYTYDAVGSRTTAFEYLDGGVSRLTWSYDAANRLTSETRRDLDNTALYTTRYAYDGTGNRTRTITDGLRTDSTYNALDQLTQARGADGSTAAFSYDGRGNRQTSQVTLRDADPVSMGYSFDALDRLVQISLPEGAGASYAYDPDGRRISATNTFPAAPATTTRYVWDELTSYGDVIAELNADGAVTASYTLGLDRLVSQTRAGTSSYYQADALGSTRALANSSASVTDTYNYTAYGELYSSTGTTPNSYLYTGQQYDAASNLYSLRARSYDPATGGFLSQDTYPVNYSSPRELSRYGYVAGNPVNGVDPSGHGLVEFVGQLTDAVKKANQHQNPIFQFGLGFAYGAAGYIVGTYVYAAINIALEIATEMVFEGYCSRLGRTHNSRVCESIRDVSAPGINIEHYKQRFNQYVLYAWDDFEFLLVSFGSGALNYINTVSAYFGDVLPNTQVLPRGVAGPNISYESRKMAEEILTGRLLMTGAAANLGIGGVASLYYSDLVTDWPMQLIGIATTALWGAFTNTIGYNDLTGRLPGGWSIFANVMGWTVSTAFSRYGSFDNDNILKDFYNIAGLNF